jgi:hypothetical protein
METRPGRHREANSREHRGSGPGVRKRRSDALGLRKDIIIRLPEDVARQLKVVAACEGVTVQEFCERLIVPEVSRSMEKHGLSAEQITR